MRLLRKGHAMIPANLLLNLLLSRMTMAQFFLSRSSKDKEMVDLLSGAFAATSVKGVFEEFEAIRKGHVVLQIPRPSSVVR